MTEQEIRELQERLGPSLAGELTEIVPGWRNMDGEEVGKALAEYHADLKRQADATLDTINALGGYPVEFEDKEGDHFLRSEILPNGDWKGHWSGSRREVTLKASYVNTMILVDA